MNVQQMVKTMRTLSIGKVYSDPDADEVCLTYLNLAHDELYRKTAILNKKVSIRETLVNNIGESFVTLSRQPFVISTAYCVGKVGKLSDLSLEEFDVYILKTNYQGMPEAFNNIESVFNFYPFVPNVQYTFNIRYVPERTPFDLTTSESSIPYPLSFHGVLLDGGLYYLFQDEGGFKNTDKQKRASDKWEEGKTDLISYMYGTYRKTISTFENA